MDRILHRSVPAALVLGAALLLAPPAMAGRGDADSPVARVLRVDGTLRLQRGAAPAPEDTFAQLRALLHTPGLGAAPAAPRLHMIQALRQTGNGTQIHFVPVAEVLYFEAADKYVRVVTATREYLIRTPLKELAAQLDPAAFWQVHRGTLVRASAIASATRDEAGRLHLHLHERPERLAVSRLYAHLFKAM